MTNLSKNPNQKMFMGDALSPRLNRLSEIIGRAGRCDSDISKKMDDKVVSLPRQIFARKGVTSLALLIQLYVARWMPSAIPCDFSDLNLKRIRGTRNEK